MSPIREFPPFRLDACNQCLWRVDKMAREERIVVTPKAFAVLEYLVEHAGRLVRHEELLESVWPDRMVEPQAVKKRILDVRNALGDNPKTPLFIETVPKRGYRFIAPVSKHFASRPSVSVILGTTRERMLPEICEALETITAECPLLP
jgi:DNA-binding winged helix-turn-helix (wHTH) protein